MKAKVHLWVTGDIACIEFDQPGSEVNLLDTGTMQELRTILESLQARTDISGVLVTSKKSKIFIAGADIREVESLTDRGTAFRKSEEGKDILQRLADLRVPTAAVINGACLGGGFELALACRYRVASFSDAVKIGLPEVQLGIIPGFGGTVRLPKLVGMIKALPLVLTGKLVGPKEALKLGFVDALFPEETLFDQAVAFLKAASPERKDRSLSLSSRFFERTPIGRALVFRSAKKSVLQKTRGAYPAPLKAIEVMERGCVLDPVIAYRLESAGFAELIGTDVAKNLIKLYHLHERFKKFTWTDLSMRPEPVRQCGVIGAGVMGGGLAHLLSDRNIPVRLRDIRPEALGSALREAYRIYSGALRRKKIKPFERARKMSLISAGITEEGLRRCGIVLEAVVEDMSVKQKVFIELGTITGPETILASNTSALSIHEMAKVTTHPERVIGLHFFNPVHRMPLVEVIPAAMTSKETIERTVQFARSLGKLPVVVRDVRGFLVNRILVPYINEAAYLMEEGVSPVALDGITKKFGMPMGPAELIDHIGVDIGHKVARILEEAYGARMKVAPLMDRLKDKGFYGKRVGAGLYRYRGDTMKLNPDLDLPKMQRLIPDEEMLKRLIYPMVNEASRCLEEHVVAEPGMVDIAMILGTGFPPFRADDTGIQSIAEDLSGFAVTVDRDRFEVAPLLKKMADNGHRFYS
jgi:3-hydroxyacyl-CoA dehydrogenase/enoyl-CoA hydratase/3-hydroxybutyryl-CoA epimerase